MSTFFCIRMTKRVRGCAKQSVDTLEKVPFYLIYLFINWNKVLLTGIRCIVIFPSKTRSCSGDFSDAGPFRGGKHS